MNNGIALTAKAHPTLAERLQEEILNTPRSLAIRVELEQLNWLIHTVTTLRAIGLISIEEHHEMTWEYYKAFSIWAELRGMKNDE